MKRKMKILRIILNILRILLIIWTILISIVSTKVFLDYYPSMGFNSLWGWGIIAKWFLIVACPSIIINILIEITKEKQ
jgi:hypothetical protein